MKKLKNKIFKHKKILFFIICSYLLLILWLDFFLTSGFWYNLDSVFFPVYTLPDFFSTTIFRYILSILNYILGYSVFLKLYFLVTLFVWSWLGYKIAHFLIAKFSIKWDIIQKTLYVFSALFTLASPFIYERLMSQVGIALWVFFIGLGFVYLLEFLDELKNKKLYIAAVFFGLSFSVFPQCYIYLYYLNNYSHILLEKVFISSSYLFLKNPFSFLYVILYTHDLLREEKEKLAIIKLFFRTPLNINVLIRI